MAVQTVIKKRRDTAANWLSVNPILAAGEEGYETDTGLSKIGNATDAWVDLDYVSIAVVKEKVQNSTGSVIAKGAVVYISGANGDNALVSLADADSEATSSKTLGLASAAIANGAIGAITTNGFIEGLNTSAATAGQSVWLSSTAGGFVFGSPPAKPAHSVYLGVVTRAHANQGAILVKVQNGYELNELHDLNIVDPVDGQALVYSSGVWVNGEGAGGGGLTVSETAPASPAEGDMWFASAEGKTYVYYDSFWVEMSPAIAGPQGPEGPSGQANFSSFLLMGA
jgi:ribosomal protein L35AE/L33A